MAEMKQKELWTPPEKMSAREKDLAWRLFIEIWHKAAERTDTPKLDVEAVYKRCKDIAKSIVLLEGD